MPERHPELMYRRFWNCPMHVADLKDGTGRFRLASSLFKTKEMSLLDGADCDPEECTPFLLNGERKVVGIASVPKELLRSLGLEWHKVPVPDDIPAHSELLAKKVPGGSASALANAATIVIQAPGVTVVSMRDLAGND